MQILGLSAYYHDSAACLLEDGHIVAAAQEERFSRTKHDAGFPEHAIEYCLKEANIELNDLDYISFYDKPFLKFERLLETYVAFAPKGFVSFSKAMPLWIKEKLFQKELIKKYFSERYPDIDWDKKLLFAKHHQSHAASAFFPSPFNEAVILTMDGVGEWATTSVAIGKGNQLDTIKEIHFPHSLGLLYSAFTYFTGFKVNSGEYKLMGLAPYGKPRFKDIILKNLIDIKDDGSFKMNMAYFDYCTGLRMTNKAFSELFNIKPRTEDQPVQQEHMDLAASIQAVTEEVMLKITSTLATEYDIPNLCLAGGVALNCVANGKILKSNNFKNIWIQPAAGDAGGAVGAAYSVWHTHLGNSRDVSENDSMQGSYLGPEYSQAKIEDALTNCKAKFKSCNDDEMIEHVAQCLANEKAVGWFQGRMEFGPRALGGRSILADPRSAEMQKTLNLKVKYRESFRPFAPSILREDLSNWFDMDTDSPYMLLVAEINSSRKREMTDEEQQLFGIDQLNAVRSEIPAVTHVDYSARIQTVHERTNPRYHALLKKFKELTTCPVLVNTSFNVRGEPIVCTPEDAFRCFMGTEMDILAIGNCLLIKEEQDPQLKLDYKNEFELD